MATSQSLPADAVPEDWWHDRLLQSLADQLGDLTPAGGFSGIDFEECWRRRVLGQDRGERSALSDHLWSLGCEQREDFRSPTFRTAVAKECFERVYRNNIKFITASIVKLAAQYGVGAEHVASRALENLYFTYWAPNATQQYRGEARISTAAIVAAKRLASELSRRGKPSPSSARSVNKEIPEELEDASQNSRPLALIEGQELHQGLQACLEQLSAKDRIMLTWILIDGLSGKEVAARMKVSPARVSQRKRHAMQKLASCMVEGGY